MKDIKKNKAEKRLCIFCTQPGMTKEDYWPQWLEKLSLRKGDQHGHWTSFRPADGEPTTTESIRPGSTLNSKLGRVCGKCNNEWMSRIQTAAAPILTKLIGGEWPKIDDQEKLTLAQWATMFAMVVEFVDPKTVAISQTQRTAFKDTQNPPFLFKVWMGRYVKDGNNHGGFYHRGLVCYPLGTPRPDTSNVQSNVFAVGEVLFVVISAQDNYVMSDGTLFSDVDLPLWIKLGTRPIWPSLKSETTKPERVLDDVDYLNIAQFLSKRIAALKHLGIVGPPF